MCVGLFIANAAGLFEAKTEPAVLTERVVEGSIEETVLANGVVEPAMTVSVGAQVSGQLKLLHVELGQAIKAGDLIAEIDSTPQKNALRIAEASIANVRAERKARAIQFDQAERVYNRQKALAKQNAGTTLDLDAAEASFLALGAQVESLDAQIARAEVEVENAQANLDYTKIRAPIDGVVVAVVTKAGQTLNSNQAVPTVVVLAQLDVMRVKVQISEADIARVKPGQDVRFTIMGKSGEPTKAVLTQIEPAPPTIATEITATTTAPAVYYNGLFETPNADGRLRPMMNTVVTIIVGRAKNVTLVPWSALTQIEGDRRFRVQVQLAGGGVAERMVTVGLTDRIKTEVIDGLDVGEEVIIPADGKVSETPAF